MQSRTAAIRLRKARREDQQRIKQLVREAGINRLGLDWRRFWTACDPGERVLGIGQVKPHRDGSHELASLVVEPGMRRQGIASQLVSRLILEHPIPLWLVCRDELVVFYSRFGFRPIMEPAQMPPYFRRVVRVVELAGRLRGEPFPLAILLLGYPRE